MKSKGKLINLALVITPLFGFLEWGGNNKMFLFQGEWDVLSKLFTDPVAAIHPFTVLPMLGQIILIITLFQKEPSRTLSLIGMGCIGILLLLIFLIGIWEVNIKTTASTLPFLICSVLAVRLYIFNKSKLNT